MEIKAQLNKPYTERQRIEFIVEYNHQQGYEIQETETELQAWGYTQEEKEEQRRQRNRQEILDKLDKLDLKSIRAIRANDEEYIAQYEAQAQELRKQLQEL